MTSASPILELIKLHRAVRDANSGGMRTILDSLDLALAPGEVIALIGRSGAGKTTLLHLAAGLDQPDAGEVRFESASLNRLPEHERARLRRRRMGLVFQNSLSHTALPAWENVALPLLLEGAARRTARSLAETWLERVGLAGLADAAMPALSGGQRRRLGLARALITRPALLLADEPTADLDAETAAQIETVLFSALADTGAAALIVTHEPTLRTRAHRALQLAEGTLSTLNAQWNNMGLDLQVGLSKC